MVDRWKPRHYSSYGVKRYCSPACGARCSEAEYNAAVEAGDKLAQECGDGWSSYVSENLGWHFCAVHKGTGATIYKKRGRGYWGQVATDGSQITADRGSAKLTVKALAFRLQCRSEACMNASNKLYGR